MRPSTAKHTEVLVIGGGIVGLSVALFAAREGLGVVLIDARPFGSASTARSGALIRTHYSTPVQARLALDGLHSFEQFDELIGGPCGFERTGFAYVPEAAELQDGSFEARVAMLHEQGVDTMIVTAAELEAIDPALDVSDVGCAAYEPRSGYADPGLTTASLAFAARGAGADLRSGVEATALREHEGSVVGADTSLGPLLADRVCVSAGARSKQLGETVGLDLPLTPTVINLLVAERRVRRHLTVIDAAGGIYFRPDLPHATLCGLRAFGDVVLDEPDEDPPAPSFESMAPALHALQRRLPSAQHARPLATRAGQLDMTPDGKPLLGPTELDGLWLSCGWSGTGFKTGLSAGRALARWLASGVPPDPALRDFAPDRDQLAVAGPRSPH